MQRQPTKTLPKGTEIELRVTITLGDKLIGQGFLMIDTEGKAVSFKPAGLAAQAGAYEVLRAIWPEEVDFRPASRIIDDHSENSNAN